MTLARLIDRIARWWRAAHPKASPLSAIPGWKDADRREARARARRCTQAVHRAREAKRAALHANMAGRA